MAKVKRGSKRKARKEVVVPKILIGVPILAWTHEFAMSFLSFWTDLMTYQHKGRRFHVAYKFMYRSPVHMAEEKIVEAAIAADCTHVMFMDDDIYDITAQDFLKLLDDDKDIVCGAMFASGFPHALCAFRRYDTKVPVANMPILNSAARLYEIPPDQRTGLVNVDLSAYGFALFKTSIFKKLKQPWFTCNTQAPTDSWFSDSVLNAGLEYVVDFDVKLNHRGVNWENRDLWIQMGLRAAGPAGDNMIMLTPEEMTRHNAFMAQKLVEAETKLEKKRGDKLRFYKKSNKEAVGSLVNKKEK